jgi:hypothetical protein
MTGFLNGMKIDYIAIIIVSLNKAVYFRIYLKNSVLCHLEHKMFGFLNGKKTYYIAILTATSNKAVFIMNLS